LLNQTVQIVETLNDLPAAANATINDFYYVKEKNILCVWLGGT
jgi:hypothetical protein